MFARSVIALATAALALAAPTPTQQPFQISTPSDIAQCAPATFSWTPTVSPYYLTIHYADSDSDFTPETQPIVVRSAHVAAWIIDYPAGTRVQVSVRDATGEVTATLPMVVGEGSTECMEDVEEAELVEEAEAEESE